MIRIRHVVLLLFIFMVSVVPMSDVSDADDVCTVTFQLPDGTVLSTQQVAYGGYVDISAIPDPTIPSGATFLGWGDVTQRITQDTVFTALISYSDKVFTVRYFADDRTTLMYTERVADGNPATYAVIPTKDDDGRYSYTFEGWSSDLTSVRSDMDVYPIFSVSERMCEVRFFDYDRSIIYVRQVPYGSSLTDMPDDPSREPTVGYTYEFDCWSITPNGRSPASFDNVVDTRFVYAYYEPHLAEYTVSFMMDGEIVKEMVMEYNSQVDASAVLDLKDGYLAKMYRDPELSREFSIGFTVIGNTNVYVSLIPGNYSCERDADGKVISDTVHVSHDEQSISHMSGSVYDICDISQFPNGAIAVLDHDSIVSIKDMLGGDAMLRISLPRGSVEITASALCDISDGKDVSISVTNGPSSVKITSALKKIQYSAYYNMSVKVDGRSVTSFPEQITMSFPLALDEGQNPVAWSVSSKGLVTQLTSSYANGRISFSTDSIQYVALGTDTPGTDTEEERVVLPYGVAEYSTSGSGSVYGMEDSPQSKLTSIQGDFKGGILFVPSSFDNRPLTYISADAFAGVTDAQAIVIPMTVTTFEWMDWSCTTKEIYFLGDRPEFVGTPPSYVRIHSLSDRSGWEDTEVHDRYLYNGSVGKDPFSFRFMIIEGHAYIDRYVSGSYMVIPSSVMADGREYTISYIGDAAFMNTSNLSLMELYGLEFEGYSLETIEIPTSVTEIMTLAFCGSTLKDMYGAESVLHIGDGAFRNCSSLTPVTLHSSLLYIGNDAFLACSSKAFSKISIPSSVEYIGNSAFYACSGLVNVSLDCRITSIPDSCFAQCTSLTNISIPDTVVSIGDSAFYNCDSILYIDLMSTETVGSGAFQCAGKGSRLECVVFGESLTTLGRNAFSGCTDLAEMEVYCPKPSGMDEAFQGVDLKGIRLYATSDVAGDWSDFDIELLDEPEEGADHTMTYVVVGMIVFFVVAGILSLKYRTKFE